MLRIADIEEKELDIMPDIDDDGCGLTGYVVTFNDGTTHEGITCSCGEGCGDADYIAHLGIGDEYKDLDEFLESIH